MAAVFSLQVCPSLGLNDEVRKQLLQGGERCKSGEKSQDTRGVSRQVARDLPTRLCPRPSFLKAEGSALVGDEPTKAQTQYQ